MRGRKRKLFNILAVIMVVSMLAATVSAQPLRSTDGKKSFPEAVQEQDVEVVKTGARYGVIGEEKGKTEPAVYIIMFEDAPVALYKGGIEGLESTNPATKGESKLDVRSAASVAYEAYLESAHAAFISELETLFNRSVDAKYDYLYAFNGMAVELTPQEAAEVAALGGVVLVRKDFDSYIDTDAGPEWIGADHIWDGSSTGGAGTQGEGVLVGILDTGLNLDHPSFAEVGGDGYVHANPLGSGVYKGLCLSEPGTYVCNDKTIGYYIYTGETTEDTDGHGSHTGSTTAGNHLTTTMFISASIDVGGGTYVDTINNQQYRAHISGVAPHANIIGYDVCNDTGGCPNSGSLAAINQAVADQVDVINYSIGGGAQDPWSDPVSLAYLGAAAAGVVPVTSAGNSGPGAGTVGSPGNSPWMLVVGASFHNRAFPNALINMTGGDTTPPAGIDGLGFSSGTGPLPIVYAGDFGDAMCLNPFAAGTWTNDEIVVCDRGVIARVQKGVNVLAGGAGGYILANSDSSQTLNGDAHALPAVHISYSDGVALKAWLADGGSEHMATIQGSILDTSPSNGDQMASFSSRGPNVALLDVIKPDVTAPGVDILAAYQDERVATDDFQNMYGFASGTSMSSPHTAGAAALMKALHPDWTTAEIISVLVSTGNPFVNKEDDATPGDPFDFGGGYVDLMAAGMSPLVLDTTETEFENANPAIGGDPKELNIATMANSQCLSVCTWTRTVRNTSDGTGYYQTGATSGSADLTIEVSPAVFNIPSGATQELIITATVAGDSGGNWLFGDVYLDIAPNHGFGELQVMHMPVGVIGVGSIAPDLIEINTRRDAGSQLVSGLQGAQIYNFDDASYGLFEGIQEIEQLPQDPTNQDPYDSPVGTFYITTTVPSGAMRLVAETIESAAADLDLYVGTGPTPSEATEVCSSTSPAEIEYCNIDEPAAGTWWILVQNWTASANAPDTVVLSWAVVDDVDLGNMYVTGPMSVPPAQLFDIRVFFNDPDIDEGEHWYGVIEIHDGERAPDQIFTIPVDLIRHEDDVYKEADPLGGEAGDTITYTLTVLPNITLEDLTYTITDTIPAGMTYVEGSATANFGEVNVVDGVVTWTGILNTPFGPGFNYVMSDSFSDPLCDTGWPGYIDAESEFGYSTNPNIYGDTVAWNSFSSSGPAVNFYGQEFTGFGFTDDGFAVGNPGANWVPSPQPWVPQSIPDPTLPNSTAALYWHDFQIVHDAENNYGVTLVAFGSTYILIEYDDIFPYGGEAPAMDMEILMARTPDDTPGAYEVVYAYDNVNFTPSDATIGVENGDGDLAVALVNDGDPSNLVDNGYMVCFDWRGPALDAAVITYQVTIDEDGPCGESFVNTAYHQTDNPGSLEDSVFASVQQPLCAPTSVSLSDLSGQNGTASMLPLLAALGGAVLVAGALALRRRREV